MPTYEYKCEKCGHIFEKLQKMSDDPIKNCEKEKCDGEVKRVIYGGTTTIFKGSGFYVNDYGKKEAKRKEEDKKEEVKSET